MTRRARQGDATASLALLAIGGQIAGVALMIVLAGRLSIEEFDAYVVAAAAFLLMLAIAPQGADKLALRIVPPLLDRRDWDHVRGYAVFGVRRALIGASVVGAIGVAVALWLPDLPTPTRIAVAASVLALPAGALAQIGLEFLTAIGLARTATAIVRLVVPGLVLAFAIGTTAAGGIPTGAQMIAAWGAAWVAAVALMMLCLRARAQPVLSAPRKSEDAAWSVAARPLWLYRIVAGLMAQAGVLSLELSGAPPVEVGAYAAAASVVSLIVVLATATNRAYARELAIRLERRDFAGIAESSVRRRRWLLPATGVILAAVLIFPREILALFRPELVEAGVMPMRILVAATAVSMTFALAPTFLKYRGLNRLISRTMTASVALQIVLLILLVPRIGAAGAAIGYAVSSVLMYGSFAGFSRLELGRLRRTEP